MANSIFNVGDVEGHINALSDQMANLSVRIRPSAESGFETTFSSSMKIGNYKFINERIKINSVPTAADVAIITLPSGMSFGNYGGIIPLFKGSQWGTPGTIIYGYIGQNTIVCHSSELTANQYITILYFGL